MVSINFPTNQLSCSGVGQAGTLTDAIRKAEIDIRNHHLDSIEQYLDRLGKKISEILDYSWYDPRKWAWSALTAWVKKQVLSGVGSIEDARYDKDFMKKEDVKDRFKRFYQRTCEEIKSLNKDYGYDLPMPGVVIFGHTHQPFGWNSTDMHIDVPEGGAVRLFNTGGWLTRNLAGGQKEFCGAEVFKYDTARGFSSEPVK
jgi:hypothetical protein